MKNPIYFLLRIYNYLPLFTYSVSHKVRTNLLKKHVRHLDSPKIRRKCACHNYPRSPLLTPLSTHDLG